MRTASAVTLTGCLEDETRTGSRERVGVDVRDPAATTASAATLTGGRKLVDKTGSSERDVGIESVVAAAKSTAATLTGFLGAEVRTGSRGRCCRGMACCEAVSKRDAIPFTPEASLELLGSTGWAINACVSE